MSSAAILGCEGHTLTDWEKGFFTDLNPWGFILFARNIDTPDQVAALCAELRATTGNANTAILIDQEGGRVQRLRSPHWYEYPTARSLGELANKDIVLARRAIWLMSRLHAFDLSKLGINVDCLPLLDVPIEGAHDVIGSRAYGTTNDRVIDLGRAACDGLLAGGLLPVIKHIPGHGRAGVDSHLKLPVVNTARAELEETDFIPFRELADQALAMTAHVVFSSIDSDSPATTSRVMIQEVIRDFIGFDGFLMSDDLSMKALSGDFAERTKACFEAGCDVVLHCNGEESEMEAVARELISLEGKSMQRGEAAMSQLGRVDGSVERDVRKEFEAIVAELG